MDGERVRDYWSQEIESIVARYKQFETLLKSKDRKGSKHPGEDGRYVESLIKEVLKKFLPNSLGVYSGFVLRPAVKTGKNGRERDRENDKASTQLDIIVYDVYNYPAFQQFGDNVVVPPEGVVAIISVKKELRYGDIEKECEALYEAGELCRIKKQNEQKNKRGPFLALVSVKSSIGKAEEKSPQNVFKHIKAIYERKENLTFDNFVGYVGALENWSIFKQSPSKNNQKARYIGFSHGKEKYHLGLQFILTGILSVFYDSSRNKVRRPGFTAFPSDMPFDKELGEISYSQLR